jgi:phosphohistidine phosphatase
MIWLLRHGDAEAGDRDDAARKLTAKGERQARSAGAALAALGVTIDCCLTSPRVRAAETARLAAEPLGVAVEVVPELAGGDFDPLTLAAGRGEVLMVGHEPDFSNAVAALTGARVQMKKGGLAAVEDRRLAALLRPAHIERLAG